MLGLIYHINHLVRTDLLQMAQLLLRVEKKSIRLYLNQYESILDSQASKLQPGLGEDFGLEDFERSQDEQPRAISRNVSLLGN